MIIPHFNSSSLQNCIWLPVYDQALIDQGCHPAEVDAVIYGRFHCQNRKAEGILQPREGHDRAIECGQERF